MRNSECECFLSVNAGAKNYTPTCRDRRPRRSILQCKDFNAYNKFVLLSITIQNLFVCGPSGTPVPTICMYKQCCFYSYPMAKLLRGATPSRRTQAGSACTHKSPFLQARFGCVYPDGKVTSWSEGAGDPGAIGST